MAEDRRPKINLILKIDETEKYITIPYPPSNDCSFDKINKDIGRIQYFSIGNGGSLINGEIAFKFEPEEFNCALRYLLRSGWSKQA